MILIYILATIMAFASAIFATLTIGTACIVAAVLKIPDREGSPYDFLPRAWSRLVLGATGVHVVVHHPERARDGGAHIFVANHMSWFDIPALSSFLPRAKFVAKAELFKLPVFGSAMRAVGMVPIDRQKSKAAFGAYDEAAKRVREGSSVVVFPEGSRGYEYAIRPFKRGPFVLAISAGAPVVPVLVHGTREVVRKGTMLVHPGRVDVHLLEPVSVDGLRVEDREMLAERVRSRMVDALASIYGIDSAPQKPPTDRAQDNPSTTDTN